MEEDKRLAEEKAEKERLAEEQRKAEEERRLAEEKAEKKRLAEEQRKAEEERWLAEEKAAKGKRHADAKAAEEKSKMIADHYRINGDGTVIDTMTGLMWKRCSEGQSGNACNGDASGYSWNDAMFRFGSEIRFAGYSDWRMPRKDELSSLVYCRNGMQQTTDGENRCISSNSWGDYQGSTINQQAFPNTPSEWYWSSTANNLSEAWLVGFVYGDGLWGSRNTASPVRLVRSGQ